MANFNWIGQTLDDRYIIEDTLGKGGMSSVYKATDPNLKRVVAIKLIHPHLSDNPEFVVRFKEEAAAVAQLRHPNIIQVFDFNNQDDLYYMVLEFVPGETLQARLRRLNAANRRLSVTETIQFATELCEAVSYAHERGMIHRDIKPANVMLNIYGQAILMDFGIAKIVGGQSHTATGATLGTALYMSPEQIRGERVDERSDIYSIGVTLFEMVNGRPPYEADSAMTLMMMHLNDPVPNLRQIHPDTPPELVEIIEKALAKDRTTRFSSAQEMATALRGVQDRLENAAAGATVIEQPSQSDSMTQTSTPVTTTRREPTAQPQRATQTPATAAAAGRPEADATPSPRLPTPADPPAASRGLDALPFLKDKRAPTWIAGGVAGLVVLLLGAFILGGGFSGSDNGNVTASPTPAATEITVAQNLNGTDTPDTLMQDGDDEQATRTAEARQHDATHTAEALAAAASPTVTATPRPTATDEPATATSTPPPSPTPTAQPTNTAAPTQAPTATTAPTQAPTQATGPYAQINQIAVQGNDYVVNYETFNFTESLDGWHTHFFFNTVPPEQAGVPGSGPWILYYGPSPFTQYKVSDRPEGATQMCVRVANADHSLYQSAYSGINTGNCANLP